jgi:hypothetical protein
MESAVRRPDCCVNFGNQSVTHMWTSKLCKTTQTTTALAPHNHSTSTERHSPLIEVDAPAVLQHRGERVGPDLEHVEQLHHSRVLHIPVDRVLARYVADVAHLVEVERDKLNQRQNNTYCARVVRGCDPRLKRALLGCALTSIQGPFITEPTT